MIRQALRVARVARGVLAALSLTFALSACDDEPAPKPQRSLGSVAPPAASHPAAAAPSGVSSVTQRDAAALALPEIVRRERLGAGPLQVTLGRYTHPQTSGRVWMARVLPAQASVRVIPASQPAPLAQVLGTPLPIGDFVAINGGFYDADHQAMGLVIADGKRHTPLSRVGGSGVFLLAAGTPRILHRRAVTPALLARASQALQSIDRLVHEGRSLVRPRPGLARDARSAVALDAADALWLVIVFDERAVGEESDGRLVLDGEATTTGLTLQELARWLAAPTAKGGLGARYAMNLDGGESTSMRLSIGGAAHEVVARRATINAVLAERRRAPANPLPSAPETARPPAP